MNKPLNPVMKEKTYNSIAKIVKSKKKREDTGGDYTHQVDAHPRITTVSDYLDK